MLDTFFQKEESLFHQETLSLTAFFCRVPPYFEKKLAAALAAAIY